MERVKKLKVVNSDFLFRNDIGSGTEEGYHGAKSQLHGRILLRSTKRINLSIDFTPFRASVRSKE